MKAYAGIDLHSSNNYIGIIDENGKRLFNQRVANRMPDVLKALRPFKKSMQGVVVESTYNWYWLVDGLQENGFSVHLANPAAVKQYEGLKHSDDRRDAFWLAHLLQLGILPQGYIYPKQQRPVRDLLRRRLLFVKQRTAHILSLQSMINRNCGYTMPGSSIKAFSEKFVEDMFQSEHLVFTAKCSIRAIQELNMIIKKIENEVNKETKLKPEFELLLTVPGIGQILGATIMMEVGDIGRFATVRNYCSYCRCVRSEWTSNKKKKGEGNRKNGNKYLSWAYVEAAHLSLGSCAQAQKFYQRKKSMAVGAVATKALANKLARASYYVMRDQVRFDPDKLFG